MQYVVQLNGYSIHPQRTDQNHAEKGIHNEESQKYLVADHSGPILFMSHSHIHVNIMSSISSTLLAFQKKKNLHRSCGYTVNVALSLVHPTYMCSLSQPFKAYWLRDAPSLTFNNSTPCPHCIDGFCVDLRTNSDLCLVQSKLISFYNRDETCLLRGTDWVFK
jgi:hypothetical protein